MTETERQLERIARAWADQEPVDWSAAERSGKLSAVQIEHLRSLDEVTQALRRVQRTADPGGARPAPLFRWGALEVQARLDAGSQGEIYRAYDPVLAQTVALKLSRGHALHAASLSQQLQEVRGLAKVRHRNVLSIYGAAEHDGRFGIWTEFVDGVTLEQQLAADGPMSVDDALALGRDLLHALMAVHARGLIHGDIKTGNVLRERGGRIVLADFGSCRLQREAEDLGSLSGTRHYLPPEVLCGTDAGIGGDTYATAVVLYRMLSGHYPYTANTLNELTQAQQAGAPIPLLHWRPEVPEEVSQLLSRALAREPAQRLSQPVELLEALGAMARARHPAAATRRLAIGRVAMMALLLIAIAIGSWWAWWRVAAPSGSAELEFARESRGQLEPLTAASTLRTGDLLALTLTLAKPSFVYIFNEDAGGQVNVLFPLADLDQQNPLPATTAELPGKLHGKPFRWRVSSAAPGEEFLVVVAPFELADLAQARSGAVAPAMTTAGTPEQQRGVAALQAQSQTLPRFEGTGLSTLVEHLARRTDMELVQIRRFQFAQRD